MLVLPQMVEMTWCSLNREYYINKGYEFTKCRDKFLVYVLDLPEGSGKLVETLCDYCGKTIFKQYDDYVKWKVISPVNKDACKKCIGKKIIDSNQLTYGVNCTMQVDAHKLTYKNAIIKKYGVDNIGKSEQIKDKKIKTNLERYGVPYVLQMEEVKQKTKESNRIRYGVDAPTQSPIIREKIAKSMYENGNVRTSKTQQYLNKLLGGILNYPIGNLNLDIAFPNEKIYIEYDGGGHKLCVLLNNISEQSFKYKEIKRYKFLKSKGWKQIKIISPYDYLPDDNFIIEEINSYCLGCRPT